jgi:hypothetical protein
MSFAISGKDMVSCEDDVIFQERFGRPHTTIAVEVVNIQA